MSASIQSSELKKSRLEQSGQRQNIESESREQLIHTYLNQIENLFLLNKNEVLSLTSFDREQFVTVYKDSLKFELFISRLINVNQLFKKGIELFEDVNHFNTWLNEKNDSLKNITPFEYIKEDFNSIDEVYNILGRIEHGIIG